MTRTTKTPEARGDASRRTFLKQTASASALAMLGLPGAEAVAQGATGKPPHEKTRPQKGVEGVYEGSRLDRVAFPMGGIGAGMICLEGSGVLSHVSIRGTPDMFNEPGMYAAVSVASPNGITPRVLEGPLPTWKIFGGPGSGIGNDRYTPYGFPRFQRASFTSRFPFGTVSLTDDRMPLAVTITGWSPFIPNDGNASSLPAAALEYQFTNTSHSPLSAVFSYNAANFMQGPVGTAEGGFTLGTLAQGCEIAVSEPTVKVNHAWFRADIWDPWHIVWRDIAAGRYVDNPPVSNPDPAGATLAVPFDLAPGASKTITVRFAWYAPSPLGSPPPGVAPYKPWYAGRFANVTEASRYWRDQYTTLRNQTQQFTDCFYDSTLPADVVDIVANNLSILKSTTMLRQSDGRLWLWEGSGDHEGRGAGSCTHVWNYAQAVAHLFPALERTLRETEFGPSEDSQGAQTFRTHLPIRPLTEKTDYVATDGQLGGILKVYRDWRISGDTAWLRGLWPNIQKSLDYCIRSWDPGRTGILTEIQHNTYDIEFHGPNGMCTSFYLGALRAAVLMGHALHVNVSAYQDLYTKGVAGMEKTLFDGEYFIQHIVSHVTQKEIDAMVPEQRALYGKEGPNYQYGAGCLSDGVIGSWMALVCGVGQVVDVEKIKSHLTAVYRYNFQRDLSDHANTQRTGFALGHEAGLLLCSWPKGGELTLPFGYSGEVWTGVEFQVASHMILLGLIEPGLDIVRAVRARYDGRIRNPFDEYEYGHWYGRALASYALLQALSGARYDAVEQVLYLEPRISGDFRSFLSTAKGYGTVGVRHGKPFFDVKVGTVTVRDIRYKAY